MEFISLMKQNFRYYHSWFALLKIVKIRKKKFPSSNRWISFLYIYRKETKASIVFVDVWKDLFSQVFIES